MAPDKDQLVVVSQADGYALMLPGKDWQPTCNDEILFRAESGLGFFSFVQVYKPEKPTTVERFLEGTSSELATMMRAKGDHVTKPTWTTVGEDGRRALGFEATSAGRKAKAKKTLHISIAKRRKDGVLLHYMVSWTGPANWGDELLAKTRSLMTIMARDFYLLAELEE